MRRSNFFIFLGEFSFIFFTKSFYFWLDLNKLSFVLFEQIFILVFVPK